MTTTHTPDDETPLSVDEPELAFETTSDAPDDMDRPRRLRPLLWRLHFFGGFLAAPIAVWLAITGIAFAWNPQIESALHSDKLTAASEGDVLPLSEQVDGALDAYPGHDVVDVTPASRPGKTTAVQLTPPGAEAEDFDAAPGQLTAYVDPTSAEVAGHILEEDRPDEWLKNLHSNFRLGDGPLTDGGFPNTLTELSASWVLVSLATGVYLWWPKTLQGLRRSLVPRVRGLRSGRRKPWRDLHSTVGVLILLLIAGMVATGLTWTEYAGERVTTFKDALNTSSPSLDTEFGGAGAGEDGDHQDHAEGSASTPLDADVLDQVDTAAVAEGLNAPYTITPGDPGTAWSVQEDDLRWPIREAQIAVDPETGAVTDRLQFSDNALLDQLTTLGIRFHQAELFGLFNQILLTVLALGLIVLIVSGYMAWWRRRPKGAFGAPPKPGPLLHSTPIPLLAGFAVVLWLLPALGVSFLIYLVIERAIWVFRRPRTPAEPAASP